MKYKKDKAALPYMGAMTAAQQAAQSILPQEQQQQVGQSSVMNTSLGNVVQRSRKPKTGLQDFSDPNQMVQDSQIIGGNQAFLSKSPLYKKEWMQEASKDIEERGTKGVCTGEKFGGPTCPPGSKRYNLAKTFKKIAKKNKK